MLQVAGLPNQVSSIATLALESLDLISDDVRRVLGGPVETLKEAISNKVESTTANFDTADEDTIQPLLNPDPDKSEVSDKNRVVM